LRLLIIDNYDSFTFNIVQLVEQCGVLDFMMVKNDELLGLEQSRFDKVIISPGPGIAVEAGQLNEFLKLHYRQKAFLGICLGHEAIAELFGAKLMRMPEPWHGIQGPGFVIGTDRLFKGLPKTFKIGHYHSWILDEVSIPKEIEITMKDENGLIMAIRHKEYDLTGLQFHPESIMTEYGLEMIKNWLEL
jgi:anthranilate synthase component 2